MGLLDGLMNDPGTMGLLGGGAAMLNASGPSIMPHSLGQIVGQGLSGMQDGYKNSLALQQQAIKFQMEQQQLMQAVRQGKITGDMYQLISDRLKGGGSQQGSEADQSMQSPSTAPQPSIPAPTAASMPMGSGFGSMSSPQPSDNQASVQPAQASQPMPRQGSSSVFGMSPDALLGGMVAGPAELGKAMIAANAPTDLVKSLRAAGIDPDSSLGKQFLQQNLAKQNYIAPVNARPGTILRDPLDPSKIIAYNPHIPDGGMPQFDGRGNVTGISALPGAANVTQGMAAASASGKNSVEPMAGVDYKGQPVFTNKLDAATGGMQMPVAGDRSSFQIPPSVQQNRNAGQLQILQGEMQDPNLSPEDRAALSREITRVRPSAPPGFAESQSKLAGAGADRYIGLINQASDSPTRVNVYDNILKLSKEGVQTGPSADWSNKLKGYTASIPGVDSMFPGMKKDVSNYQEINKFMYQNAQRNWQAAGGTGTDSQLEAFSKSSPNSVMFPQALQAMAQWGKAGELALQGKVNAAQSWKDSQGGNVANQDNFERAWRNNFDPQLFQLKTMEPEQAAAYVANLKKTNPNGYSALMMKATALKNIGGL